MITRYRQMPVEGSPRPAGDGEWQKTPEEEAAEEAGAMVASIEQEDPTG